MAKINILAIVGSLRRGSINRMLALEAGSIVGSQLEQDFTLLEYDDVPLMNQDAEYPPPDSVKRVRDIVKSADGIWFFSPEYNHSIPGVLKNLIDWLSRPISDNEPQVLAHKPAAVSGISPGMSGAGIAQDHLVTLLSFLNMRIMNSPRLLIPNAKTQMTADGQLALTNSLPFLEKQALDFVRFISDSIPK